MKETRQLKGIKVEDFLGNKNKVERIVLLTQFTEKRLDVPSFGVMKHEVSSPLSSYVVNDHGRMERSRSLLEKENKQKLLRILSSESCFS